MNNETYIAIAIMITGSLAWAALRHSVTSLYKHLDHRLDSMRIEVRRDLELLETERTRIANDLHDDLGALLSAASMRINCLDASNEKDRQHIDLLRKYINEVTQRIGTISHNLMPQALIRDGLNPAIQQFINQYQGATDTSFEYAYEVKSSIPHHRSLQVYRIVQELVHNSIKHSNCTTIQVCLFENQKKLHLLYADDGMGFNPENLTGSNGMGLSSLKDRTDILAGKIKFRARPGKGVEYYFQIPL